MGGNYETTEITTKIQSYKDGQMTQAQIVDYLVNEHQYRPQEACPYKAPSPQWWEWHENRSYTPGTWEEVLLCRNRGILDWPTFNAINRALEEKADRGEKMGGKR